MTSVKPGSLDLDTLVSSLRREVVLADLPLNLECGHPNGSCGCPEGLPTAISHGIVHVNNESSESKDWRRPLVWLADLLKSPGWDPLAEPAKDIVTANLYVALAHYLQGSRLATTAKTSIALAGCSVLESRIERASARHCEVNEMMFRALARLGPLAGRNDSLDLLRSTFGRPLDEWPRDHPATVLEYYDRASILREYGNADDPTGAHELGVLRTELLGCIVHGRTCATHGAPGWTPLFHCALADTLHQLAQLRPVNDRLSLALEARKHLVEAFSTAGLSGTTRVNCITEWGGIHRLPQDRAGHRRLQRDEVELVRQLNGAGQAGGTPMLIEALVRRGRPSDRNEAVRLLETVDVDRDFAHPSHFATLLLAASQSSLLNLTEDLASAKPGITIEWADCATRLYDAWIARHPNDISVTIIMANHCLRAYEAGADLKMTARAGSLAKRAYDSCLKLPDHRQALAQSARQVLLILARVHDHIDGLSPEGLEEIVEWALRVTPHGSYYRPDLEAIAAGVLTRTADTRTQRTRLLRSALEAFRGRGDVSQTRQLAIEYAVCRLDDLKDAAADEQVSGAREVLAELGVASSIPRDDPLFVRAQLVTGMCFHRIYRKTGDETTRRAAVSHQTTALRELDRRRGVDRTRALASITTQVFRIDRDLFSSDARLLTRILIEVTHARIGIRDSLWALSVLLNGVGSMCSLDEAVEGAQRAFDRLYETMEQLQDARHLLAKIQGWAHYLAGLLFDAGDSARAAQWLEMGSAVLLRQDVFAQWKRGGNQPVVSARPVVYLAAREESGYALVWDGGDVTCMVDLPELTQATAKGWRDALTNDRTAIARTIRSVDGATVPPACAVDDTLESMARAVDPLLEALRNEYPSLKDWIPCGDLSGLPWTAAMTLWHPGTTTPCIQASLTARQIAFERARERLHTTSVAALTNPSPCNLNGREMPLLPGATREGLWLRTHFGATVHDGPDAERDAFIEVTSRDLKVLHLAMHGVVESGLHGGTLLFMRNNAAGNTSLVSTDDLAHVHGCARLVWLGACWAGRPNSLLPDESHGLVTSVIHRLGSTVIAPLWPVDDTVAAEFAEDFYQSWLIEGVPIEEAFRRAMLYARSLDDGGSWAAFTLIGAGSSKDERAAFSSR